MPSSASAASFLTALEERQAIAAPTLLLVAHPDDEVLGASILLSLARKLRLVHATNGAPAGADDQAAVTQTRFAELRAAVRSLGAVPAQCVRFDYPDGQLVDHLGTLATALLPLVLESDLVVTHAFEGGHPDHDACALALHIACEQAADLKDHRPARVEFAIYALEKGRIVTNSFPGDEARTVLVLTEIERARKALALSAFASQRGVVEQFRLQEEQLRTAPDQDFFRLRDPRATLFSTPDPDRERRWREAAAASVGSTNT